jgi:hypothetical protein
VIVSDEISTIVTKRDPEVAFESFGYGPSVAIFSMANT